MSPPVVFGWRCRKCTSWEHEAPADDLVAVAAARALARVSFDEHLAVCSAARAALLAMDIDRLVLPYESWWPPWERGSFRIIGPGTQS